MAANGWRNVQVGLLAALAVRAAEGADDVDAGREGGRVAAATLAVLGRLHERVPTFLWQVRRPLVPMTDAG
jgi:hypothetical protein